jgi:deazaflavin-dependent oxidoreductase (nitroreductase family)
MRQRPLPAADPRAPQSAPRRAALRLAAMPTAVAFEGTLLFRLVVWRLTPILMRLTGGRFARLLPVPVGVIDTRDPRNGRRHRRCVIYFDDGEAVVVIPSKGGLPDDPHWYRNALAEPEVGFESRPFRAERVVEEEELRRLWALADGFFPACVEYRRRAARSGRTIPILRLLPR